MKRKKTYPSLRNVLGLFSRQLAKYKAPSKASYRKAFSSFQIFSISHFNLNDTFSESMIKNWLLYNLLHGLSLSTNTFYLDKISSIYSAVASKLEGGKEISFRNLKQSLKSLDLSSFVPADINKAAVDFKHKWRASLQENETGGVVDDILNIPDRDRDSISESQAFIWGALALSANVAGEIVRSFIPTLPPSLKVLELFEPADITETLKSEIKAIIEKSLYGEEPRWFAMRLRPKVKFDDLVGRLALFENEADVPELFYPSEEIAKRIGRKVVWKGKPVIRDVVFFKKRKSEIYPMFTSLYDLAWCYRTPGGKAGDYAAIPAKAMENFKKSLGILTPDCEIAPIGGLDLKPGDKVVIIDGEYVDEYAEILKKPVKDSYGNKIYRVSLLHSSGRWDIGIDARFIKKT